MRIFTCTYAYINNCQVRSIGMKHGSFDVMKLPMFNNGVYACLHDIPVFNTLSSWFQFSSNMCSGWSRAWKKMGFQTETFYENTPFLKIYSGVWGGGIRRHTETLLDPPLMRSSGVLVILKYNVQSFCLWGGIIKCMAFMLCVHVCCLTIYNVHIICIFWNSPSIYILYVYIIGSWSIVEQ